MHPETIQLETLRQKIEDTYAASVMQSEMLDRGAVARAKEKETREFVDRHNNQAKALKEELNQGYAFLDVNSNGELDSEDTPVENAAFIVTLQFGGAVGALTDKTGYAFIVAPGGVDYPVSMRMEPPEESTLKLIGPSELIHELVDEVPKFLFSSR